MTTKHKCAWCDSEFEPSREGHKFCKDTCRAAWRYANIAICGCGCKKRFIPNQQQKAQITLGRTVYYNHEHYYKVALERNRKNRRKYRDYQSKYYRKNKDRILTDVKKNPGQKEKNKYKCRKCGESAWPNRFWCPPCHSVISNSIEYDEHYCSVINA